MTEEIKDLLQEMGEAVTESFSRSSRIAEVAEKIRRAGYGIQIYSLTRFWLTAGKSDSGGSAQGDTLIQ